MRLIEIAEGRTGGLWEPLIILFVLAFTLIAPKRSYGGFRIHYGLIRFLLFAYFPAYLISLSLDSWGNAGSSLHVIARLFMGIAYIRLSLFLMLDVIVPRIRGQTMSRILCDIVHGVVYVVGTLWLLKGAGLDALSLLTTGTVLGAIIGLSLQETLGNIFAGLAVQAEQPFRVGEWINLEGLGLVGQVLEINWRATSIKTEDEEQINIPNAVIARTPIRNYNAPDPAFEVELPFSVPYHISPTQVREIAVRAATNVTWCDLRPPICGVETFDDQGIRYRLRFYSREMAQRREQISEVLENLWSGLSERGITTGYPVREVHHFPIRPPGTTTDDTAAFHALSGLDFFAPLGIQDRRQLADRLERKHYAAGERVTTAGDADAACYIVNTGQVAAISAAPPPGDEQAAPETTLPETTDLEATTSPSAAGQPPSERVETEPAEDAVEAPEYPGEMTSEDRIIAVYGPGEVFGEMTLLTGMPHESAAIAKEDCELWVLRQSMLQDVLGQSQPAVLQAIGHILAQRCAAMDIAPGSDVTTLPSRGLVEVQILDRMKRLFRLS